MPAQSQELDLGRTSRPAMAPTATLEVPTPATNSRSSAPCPGAPSFLRENSVAPEMASSSKERPFAFTPQMFKKDFALSDPYSVPSHLRAPPIDAFLSRTEEQKAVVRAQWRAKLETELELETFYDVTPSWKAPPPDPSDPEPWTPVVLPAVVSLTQTQLARCDTEAGLATYLRPRPRGESAWSAADHEQNRQQGLKRRHGWRQGTQALGPDGLDLSVLPTLPSSESAPPPGPAGPLPPPPSPYLGRRLIRPTRRRADIDRDAAA